LIAFVLAAASASDSPLTAPLAAMLQSPGSGADGAAAAAEPAAAGSGVIDGERVDADAAAAASSPMTIRTAVVMPDGAEITAAADAPAGSAANDRDCDI